MWLSFVILATDYNIVLYSRSPLPHFTPPIKRPFPFQCDMLYLQCAHPAHVHDAIVVVFTAMLARTCLLSVYTFQYLHTCSSQNYPFSIFRNIPVLPHTCTCRHWRCRGVIKFQSHLRSEYASWFCTKHVCFKKPCLWCTSTHCRQNTCT